MYFDEYGDLDVQRIMLDDKARVLAYKNAIERSRERIQGKIVLDVGSGTGILSIFCAKMGAKRVHAVEASKLADLSRKVVEENGLQDVVEVHNCTVEEVSLPEKVDVIVSEWMGFYLFHEGMLESVINARDRFLKPDGLIIPESADLWIAPCELPKYFEYWDDVHGISMKCLGEHYRTARRKPIVTEVPVRDLLGDQSVVKSVFLDTVTPEDLNKITFRTLVCATRDGNYQGLCLWFVCNFSTDDSEIIFLSTHPEEETTHWKQTAIAFPFSVPVQERDPIAFGVELRKRPDDPRKYDIEVTMLDPEKEEHPMPCNCTMPRCLVIQKYMEQTMGAS